MGNAAGDVPPRRAGQIASGIERRCAAFIWCKASLVGECGGEGDHKDVNEVIWSPALCSSCGIQKVNVLGFQTHHPEKHQI